MNNAPSALLLSLCLCLPAVTQAADPLTREQGDAILQELRLMRQALERALTPPAPPPQPVAMQEPTAPVEVGVKSAMALGSASAPVTMVAFVDYQCPFCRRFDLETFPEIKKKYIDTGKVRFVVRDLPLEFHPNAQKAAEASYCAAEQDKFWPMREKMAQNQQRLDVASLGGFARETGLRGEDFDKCLAAGKYAAAVRDSTEEARKLGVGGTPTFIIGKTGGDSITGEKVVGAQPLATFEQRLKALLGT
jgi:protein-disulfide isomerase